MFLVESHFEYVISDFKSDVIFFVTLSMKHREFLTITFEPVVIPNSCSVQTGRSISRREYHGHPHIASTISICILLLKSYRKWFPNARRAKFDLSNIEITDQGP
jgi:hypothetical protein